MKRKEQKQKKSGWSTLVTQSWGDRWQHAEQKQEEMWGGVVGLLHFEVCNSPAYLVSSRLLRPCLKIAKGTAFLRTTSEFVSGLCVYMCVHMSLHTHKCMCTDIQSNVYTRQQTEREREIC